MSQRKNCKLDVEVNPNSILFLYEGDTEKKFYQRVIEEFLTQRTIRIFRQNLKGINSSMNFKVVDRIINHLESHPGLLNVHVFVAFDRDGTREVESRLSSTFVRNELKEKDQRIRTINEVIATQDIESWFFYDIESIYNFLHIRRQYYNIKKYSRPENLNHNNLSRLFREHGRSYIKGKESEIIPNLNIKLIYETCSDLKYAVDRMVILTEAKKVIFILK